MNEELIKEIDLAGVKYTDIANIIGVKPNHFFHYIRGKLSDDEIAKIRNAKNYLVANNKTDEYAAYLQDGLKRECTDFLLLTRMRTEDFFRKIKISKQTYYDWQKDAYKLGEDKLHHIRNYLHSKRAQNLLDRRRLYRHISDCAEITGLKTDKIKTLCKSGVISYERESGNGHYFVNIEELKKYVAKHPVKANSDTLVWGELGLGKDNWRPLLSANNDCEIFNSNRYEFVNQYMVSDTGKVFNVTTRTLLSYEHDSEGYIGIHLIRTPGETESTYIHRLVAYCFCDNNQYKERVHHIDGNKQNNHASNLLWVTTEEHGECHRLMKADKKQYREFVKKIRKANRREG